MTVSVAEERRHLALAGTYNVRDVGGYATADGGTTRWHTLLRADSLHRLSEESQQELLDLGLRTIVDLRRAAELEEWPNVFAASDRVAYSNVALIGDEHIVKSESFTLAELYKAILDRRQAEIGQVFATFANNGMPALVHCTAGKDRTGLIVALALSLAGVPDEVIAEDYALTATHLTGQYLEEARERADKAGYSWDMYQIQLLCPEEYMTGTLDHLRSTYGATATYLEQCGLTPEQIARLRGMFVTNGDPS